MLIQPLYDRVLLRAITNLETASGLALPPSGTQQGLSMTVIDFGPDCVANLVKGQSVIVHKYAGIEFNYNGEKYYIVKAIDILAIVKAPTKEEEE